MGCCNCNLCGECDCDPCSCNSDRDSGCGLSRSNPFGMFKPNGKHRRKKFNSNRLVGVEWEFNRTSKNDAIRHWRNKWGGGLHYDGSCGEELVTPPLAGDYIEDCLRELGVALKRDNAVMDRDCGIHVHVDAHDLMWSDMFKLLATYSHVEPVLYAIGGQFRADGDYCVPCGQVFTKVLESEDPKGELLAASYDQSSPDWGRRYKREYQPGKKDGRRYRGLNIQPWLAGRTSRRVNSDTTVEFRIHRETIDAERVIGWAHLCATIVEWSAGASQKDIETLPANAAVALYSVIAPKSRVWIQDRLAKWRRSVGDHRRVVYDSGRYRFTRKYSDWA
jgi:hypothetical protein